MTNSAWKKFSVREGGKQMCCAAHANRTAMEGDRLGLILQYIAISKYYILRYFVKQSELGGPRGPQISNIIFL